MARRHEEMARLLLKQLGPTKFMELQDMLDCEESVLFDEVTMLAIDLDQSPLGVTSAAGEAVG